MQGGGQKVFPRVPSKAVLCRPAKDPPPPHRALLVPVVTTTAPSRSTLSLIAIDAFLATQLASIDENPNDRTLTQWLAHTLQYIQKRNLSPPNPSTVPSSPEHEQQNHSIPSTLCKRNPSSIHPIYSTAKMEPRGIIRKTVYPLLIKARNTIFPSPQSVNDILTDPLKSATTSADPAAAGSCAGSPRCRRCYY